MADWHNDINMYGKISCFAFFCGASLY